MTEELKAFFVATLLAIGIICLIFFSTPNSKLEQCAKDNNVYKCEYVAVPVKDKP